MEEYIYNNIFETKGIEYLIIIGFLVLIVPFWIIINRKKANLEIRKPLGILSAELLRTPLGLFFSRNHTWTHLEKSGYARVGLDDFLLHVTGEVSMINFKNAGDFMSKGEFIAEIINNGKSLKIASPVSGKIVETNPLLKEHPGILNEDPYGKAWMYKVMPVEWIEETSSYYLADEAVDWTKRELIRFKDFMAGSVNKYSPETSLMILQDGGEICDRPLSGLPEEVWQDFQKSFLI